MRRSNVFHKPSHRSVTNTFQQKNNSHINKRPARKYRVPTFLNIVSRAEHIELHCVFYVECAKQATAICELNLFLSQPKPGLRCCWSTALAWSHTHTKNTVHSHFILAPNNLQCARVRVAHICHNMYTHIQKMHVYMNVRNESREYICICKQQY